MSKRLIYPKDYIREVLVEEVGKIVINHPYLSFLLICSGIEFLGKCIDATEKWGEGSSKEQFKVAIIKLFPERYHNLADDLYKDLRCGMVHRFLPGSIFLTQNKNDSNGEILYNNHPYLKDGKKILVIEYFYFDFVEACKKVLAKDFSSNKMNKPLLFIG